MDLKKWSPEVKVALISIISALIGAIFSLLTTYITNCYDEMKSTRLQKRYDIRLKAEQKSNALKALRGFVKDIETLRINASMFHSALNRYASHIDNQILKETVLDRKKSYDKSYIHWFSVSQQNALFIREAQLITYPTLYEHAIEQQLIFFLKKYDDYLTRYFDDLIINKKINPERDNTIEIFLKQTDKDATTLNQKISGKITGCTKEIFNATHDWIAKGRTCNSEEWNEKKITAMYNTINSNGKCGFNPNTDDLPSTVFNKEDFCIK